MESSQYMDDNYEPTRLDESDNQDEDEEEEEEDQFTDPVFRARLERAILQQYERITGETLIEETFQERSLTPESQ